MSALPELSADHNPYDTHRDVVGGQPSPQPTTTREAPVPKAVSWQLAGALLGIHSDGLDQLEATRIATENRVRDLRMFKGGEDEPETARLQSLVDALLALEHGCELELRRTLRQHPLGGWVKRTVGIGEKQGARLIAAIGDPYLASKFKDDVVYTEPRRGPAQLWAYCGLHVLHPGHSRSDPQFSNARVQTFRPADHLKCDTLTTTVDGTDLCDTADQSRIDNHRWRVGGVAPSRRRGQRANWNATAKMRAFLVAESCIKHARSPYRADYDIGREKYADAVHNEPCVRCGPKGKPAPTGSPLSLGHQHARALRLVMKAILRDLWLEAQQLHISAEVS